MAEPPAEEPAPAAPHGKSLGERVIAGKTGPQRLLIWLGAAAAALLAIGTLISALGGWLQPTSSAPAPSSTRVAGSSSPSGAAELVVINNKSAEADAFVQLLLAADGKQPVQLNHKIVAPPGEGASIRLEYGCGSTGCSFTRLEPAGWNFEWATDGKSAWVRGCVRVTAEGGLYLAKHLDLELFRTGPRCGED